MRIRTRLATSFGSVLILLLGVVLVAENEASKATRMQLETHISHRKLGTETSLRAAVRQQLLVAHQHLLYPRPGDAERMGAVARETREKFREMEQLIAEESDFQSGQGRASPSLSDLRTLTTLQHQHAKVEAGIERAMQDFRSGKTAVAKRELALITQRGFETDFLPSIARLVRTEMAESDLDDLHFEKMLHRQEQLLWILSGVATLWVFLLAAGLTRFFVRRLTSLGIHHRRIAGGDFKTTVIEVGNDELTELAHSANQMARSLQEAQERLVLQRNQLTVSAKMAALGEMAGSIAHEINSPLAVVTVSTSLMQELLARDRVDRILLQNIALKVERTAQRIAKIVTGLRSFSRDGSTEPCARLRASSLLEETLAFCADRFRIQGIEIRLVRGLDQIEFEGRAIELSQVLLNLLNNAYDAVETLDEKWVEISGEDLGDSIQLSVKDSGRGIPSEQARKLFEPFYTSKSMGKGTGLGLSISAGIVRSHGGELSLDRECRNTRFVIRLPKHQQLLRVA